MNDEWKMQNGGHTSERRNEGHTPLAITAEGPRTIRPALAVVDRGHHRESDDQDVQGDHQGAGGDAADQGAHGSDVLVTWIRHASGPCVACSQCLSHLLADAVRASGPFRTGTACRSIVRSLAPGAFPLVSWDGSPQPSAAPAGGRPAARLSSCCICTIASRAPFPSAALATLTAFRPARCGPNGRIAPAC